MFIFCNKKLTLRLEDICFVKSFTFNMTTVLNSRIGIRNLGNTCFLNAVLQAFRITPAMGRIFLTDVARTARTDSKRGKLMEAFQVLIRDFWKHIPGTNLSVMAPNGFIHTFHMTLRATDDDWYIPGQQADSAETIQYILDSLHDSMYRRVGMDVTGVANTVEEAQQLRALTSWSDFYRKEYSDIVAQFHGQTQAKIICSVCGTVSERYEPWLMIKCPIPGANVVGGPVPTLKTCLDGAFDSENIEDYHCDICKVKTKATLRTRISRLPPTIILSFKRFTNENVKVRGKIEWDLESTDFTPWMAFPRDPFKGARDHPIYESYAVIEHLGSARGGHYRMYAKQNTDWIEYDDDSARSVPAESVVTSDSYIVFMTLKRTFEHDKKEFAEQVHAIRTAAHKPSEAAVPA
jgi:ubiquitin C-terminal hydrolase